VFEKEEILARTPHGEPARPNSIAERWTRRVFLGP
jgi:hypothetical protein